MPRARRFTNNRSSPAFIAVGLTVFTLLLVVVKHTPRIPEFAVNHTASATKAKPPSVTQQSELHDSPRRAKERGEDRRMQLDEMREALQQLSRARQGGHNSQDGGKHPFELEKLNEIREKLSGHHHKGEGVAPNHADGDSESHESHGKHRGGAVLERPNLLKKGSKGATESHGEASNALQLVLFTTLKPCDNQRIRDAQTTAIASWAALPLNPPVKVAILGGDPCGEDIAKHVDETVGPNRVFVLDGAKMGKHGTLLLGSAIRQVATKFPKADVYGFINADIVLDPRCAIALQSIHGYFSTYFLIGHRLKVDYLTPVQEGTATLPDFSSQKWTLDKAFKGAEKDRQDAEDFFLWSAKFFSDKGIKVPDFHIGRPAYDNWMVNAAIHSFQPVIDGSEAFLAYHQTHDYAHLKKKGESKKASYWGSEDQQENYKLGEANGGWQHGLIEFAPWQFRTCRSRLHFDAAGGKWTPNHKIATQGGCELFIKKDWRPLSDGAFGSLEDFVKRYRPFVRNAWHHAFDKSTNERLTRER